MGPPMNPSAKIGLLVIYAVNALVAFLWLLLYGWRHSFHLAGVYFGPGILALAGMLLADILILILLRKHLK
jgi:hypothetical protein